MSPKTKKSILVYAVAIAVPLAVGGLSALLTSGNMDVYKEVQTPPLSPPSILFPIVWTILYILMGVSSARVYLRIPRDGKNSRAGLILYGVSLFFNFFWSIFFFDLRDFALSFFWLIALFVFEILTILKYRKVDPLSAYLQIPYALWTAFAGYLNLGILLLNR